VGCEADPSPPSNSEAKNVWSYTASSPFSFMAWHSGSLTFTFVLPLMLLRLWYVWYAFDPIWCLQFYSRPVRVRIMLPGQFVFCVSSAFALCSMASKHFQMFLVNPGQLKFINTVCYCGLVKSHFCQLRRPTLACFWSYHLKS
jgi:hypothetical protein